VWNDAEMAQHLDLSFYHAGMGAEDGMNRINRWVGNAGFIVATSALGTSLDYPGIVYMLHIGVPYGMIDFAQESGRAGRGGEAVDSVKLAEEGKIGRSGNSNQSVDESKIKTSVYSKSCRRAIMSSCLNGCEIECSMHGCAACDQCKKVTVEWNRWQQKEGREMHVVQEALDELADGCAACWVTRQGEDDED
jgi:superfamily II DNA helicase RecQ